MRMLDSFGLYSSWGMVSEVYRLISEVEKRFFLITFFIWGIVQSWTTNKKTNYAPATEKDRALLVRENIIV